MPRSPGGAALPAVSTGRWRELDVLRTVVVGLVFFHAALVFDSNDDFYVQNDHTTEVTTCLAALAVVWAMPTRFLVAGMGTWCSLQRRGARRFLRARVLRLFVPLVVATLTIVPVPVWFPLRSDLDYHQSYLRFWPSSSTPGWTGRTSRSCSRGSGSRPVTCGSSSCCGVLVILLPALMWLRSDRGRVWTGRQARPGSWDRDAAGARAAPGRSGCGAAAGGGPRGLDPMVLPGVLLLRRPARGRSPISSGAGAVRRTSCDGRFPALRHGARSARRPRRGGR